MALTKRVDRYSISSYGKYDNDRKFRITLEDPNGQFVGELIYISDTTPLPDNELRGDTIVMYKHAGQAAVDLDILRNESPVQVVYYSPSRAWIAAYREPVGESE